MLLKDYIEHSADCCFCFSGTFNNRSGAKALDDCIDCLATFACDEEGLSYPYRKCAAGYFCR